MSGPPPPADLDRRTPSILQVPAGTELHRFYRLIYEPIHFDASRLGRFNAPDGAYGVLYTARTVDGAFAETFLREAGRTLLAADFIAQRGHVRLRARRALRFVELGGKGLARMGATAEILHSGLPYDVPQAWSKRLHDHPVGADGIVYGGRHDDREPCYAIFSRAQGAIEEIGRNPNLNEDWFWEIAEAYGMGLAPG